MQSDRSLAVSQSRSLARLMVDIIAMLRLGWEDESAERCTLVHVHNTRSFGSVSSGASEPESRSSELRIRWGRQPIDDNKRGYLLYLVIDYICEPEHAVLEL
jgi:hypothetical protein